MNKIIMTVMCAAAAIAPLAGAAATVPDMVTCAIADRQDFQQPDRLHLTGWIGSRIDANEKNRLVKIDPNRLLLSYHNRPGCQSYDGEHIGKWLHAASLAWNNSGDPALRQKLDTVAALRQNKMLPKLRQRMIFGCAINMLPKVCEDLALQMVDLSLKREGVDVQTQLGQEGLFGLIDLG